MDLSKLSDDDLMALKSGDLSKISTEGLMALKGAQPEKNAIEQTIRNIPDSAANFAKNIFDAVSSPAETAKGIALAAEGGARKIMPKMLSEFADKHGPYGKQADVAASAVGQFYKDRYGGLENLKKTVVQDPVGFVADASTILGVGGALAPGKVGAALNTASKATNPLSVVPVAAKATGNVAKNVFGLTTGQGPEAIGQAAKAGFTGNQTFWKNLTGEAPITDVLDEFKAGLEKMRQVKSDQYRQNMASFRNDRTVLSFDGIDRAVANAADVVSYKGQVKNARAASALQSMSDDIERWKTLPANEFHTPEGLDALKQRLGATLESIPYEEKTARLVAGKVYNSVKSEISAQAPGYAKTMADYSKAAEQITEIERGLSLGNKASKDTAMRKLQSLMRNNVNTNYGQRLDMAKIVEEQAQRDLLPALAGQSMNSWSGRGLIGQGANLATLGVAGVSGNPALLAALPFQSPKTVGAATYGLGRLAGSTSDLLRLRELDPNIARMAGLLGYQAGQIPETDW